MHQRCNSLRKAWREGMADIVGQRLCWSCTSEFDANLQKAQKAPNGSAQVLIQGQLLYVLGQRPFLTPSRKNEDRSSLSRSAVFKQKEQVGVHCIRVSSAYEINGSRATHAKKWCHVCTSASRKGLSFHFWAVCTAKQPSADWESFLDTFMLVHRKLLCTASYDNGRNSPQNQWLPVLPLLMTCQFNSISIAASQTHNQCVLSRNSGCWHLNTTSSHIILYVVCRRLRLWNLCA